MSYDREPVAKSATEVVSHVTFIPPNSHIVLWLRVSTSKQARKGNLRDQLTYLTHICTQHSLNISHIESFIGPANPANLIDLTHHCTEHNITHILAESLCRYVRHPHWTPKECHLQPTEQDLKLLSHFTRGVILTTVTDPSAELSQVRGNHIQRGLTVKDVSGLKDQYPGRKKRRRERHKAEVIQLHKGGMGYRMISKHLWVVYGERVSFMTVQRWVKGK